MNQRVGSSTVLPPIADKQPHRLSIHGDDRTDDYFWLRHREDPNVIAYLEAENDYTKAVMAHTESLQTALYDEMLARIQETDLSVPYRKGDYYYYSRTETGKAYPIYCRKAGSLDAPETVLLDQNALAEGHDFFELGLFDVSPNHQLLAYSVDTAGSERYTLFFLNLATGQLYPETILETGYGFAWGNDNQTVFYTLMDEAQRPFKLMRHRLGSAVSDDELVYDEADESYFLSVGKTRSDAYILLELGSKITSEVHYLDANQPEGKFQVIQPRSSGIEYQVEHHSDSFYIVTNDEALNFKLMQTPVTAPAKDNWQLVIPHRDQVLLEGVSAFAKHLVIYERESGLPTIRVRQLASGEEHFIQFPDPTYSADEDNNPEFDTEILRFNYTSLVTPRSVFDYNLETQERELKKETPVLGGYDRTQYASDRLMATATDGTQVPISIVYKKGLEQNGAKPLLLTGYGSYGFSYPAAFSSSSSVAARARRSSGDRSYSWRVRNGSSVV
jgi:oligopeptidase B